MIRYVVEKNGGNVSWYADDGKGKGARVDVTMFDSNGKSYTVSYYGLTNINGRLIVDSGALAADLNKKAGKQIITDEQLRHQENDNFSSTDDAALAFALMFQQKSIDEKQEYGATINKNKDSIFKLTNITNSAETAKKDVVDLDAFERTEVYIKQNISTVSSIHTHWHPKGNINFSNPADYNATYQVKSMYLVNRNGEIYYTQRSKEKGNINGFSLGEKKFSIK